MALFGRRPPQRLDGLSMPASENLHSCGRDEGDLAFVKLAAIRPRLRVYEFTA
jgi:hypothetical protein